jgi:hypothetical protein
MAMRIRDWNTHVNVKLTSARLARYFGARTPAAVRSPGKLGMKSRGVGVL